MPPTPCLHDWTLRGLAPGGDGEQASGATFGHAERGHAGLPTSPPGGEPLERPASERPALHDDGRIDGPALAAHVQALAERVQRLRPGWGAGHPALVKALQGIVAAALDEGAPEHVRGLAVRHGWAAAAAAARTVACELGVQAHLWGAKEDQARASAYQELACLFVELKRRHLSACAPHLALHHASREAKALASAGVRSGRSGDVLNSAQGVSASWSTGAWTVGGATRANEMFLIDDDIGAYYAESQQSSVHAGLGAEAGAFRAKLLGLRGQCHLGRELLAAPDTPSLSKMVLNLRANRSLVDTAGPRMRRVLDTADGARRWLARAVGKGYVPVPGAPTYLNDAKIAKGLDGTKARLACARFDELVRDGGPGLADWLATAYPAVEERLSVRMARDDELPPDWLQTTAPVSAAYRGRAFGVRLQGLALESAVGVAAVDGEGASPLLGAAAKAAVSRIQFFLSLPKASHELLDVALGGVLRALALHRELAALPREGHPQLALYDQVGALLGAGAPPDDMPEEDVPEPFRPSVAVPSAHRLERAQALCERLASEHLAFVRLAKAFTSEPDRFMSAPGRLALQQERRRAFEEIERHVWGGSFPGGWAAASTDPQAFVARSHDAMSLALGALDTHLSLMALAIGHRADGQADGALQEALAAAQAAHARTRALFDQAYLPMSRRTLAELGATLKAEGLFQRLDASVSFAIGGGLDGIGAALSGGAVKLDTQAWQAGFTVELSHQVADVQLNEVRLGEYLQLTIGARAGAPLAGALVERALRVGLLRLFPGSRAEALERDAADLARQFQGLALDVAEGGAVVLKWHRAPKEARFALQYVRGLQSRDAGLGLAVPVPTPGGLVNIGVKAATSSQSTAFEAAGPDLAYQQLLWPALEALLCGEGEPDTPTLQERFEHDPLMLSRYFARPHTLVEVLETLPELPPGIDAGALAQARQALDALHSPHARLCFHAGPGRAVFDAFVHALREREAARQAKTFHLGWAAHGFQVALGDGAHKPAA